MNDMTGKKKVEIEKSGLAVAAREGLLERNYYTSQGRSPLFSNSQWFHLFEPGGSIV